MAKGKGKGTEFERQICKDLSLWWSDGQREDIFWRSATSGARATVRSKVNKTTFGQYGDIQATDPIGQPLIELCNIELKRGYGGASIADVLDTPKGRMPLWRLWLKQALEDQANAQRDYWALITKRDRRQTVIFIPVALLFVLREAGAALQKATPSFRVRLGGEEGSVFGTPLSEFLRLTTADNIMIALTLRRGGE